MLFPEIKADDRSEKLDHLISPAEND